MGEKTKTLITIRNVHAISHLVFGIGSPRSLGKMQQMGWVWSSSPHTQWGERKRLGTGAGLCEEWGALPGPINGSWRSAPPVRCLKQPEQLCWPPPRLPVHSGEQRLHSQFTDTLLQIRLSVMPGEDSRGSKACWYCFLAVPKGQSLTKDHSERLPEPKRLAEVHGQHLAPCSHPLLLG